MDLSRLVGAALVLIDIQKGFEDTEYWGGQRNNLNAERQCGRLLHKWRTLGWPTFHIQHSSTNPQSRLHADHPGFALQDVIAPLEEEPVIVKNVNSAFIGTDLQERLDRAEIRSVVIVGLVTNHCVSTTVRMAANYGYDTFLISDATAAFQAVTVEGHPIDAQTVHDVSLASLHGEFATVLTTKELLEKFS